MSKIESFGKVPSPNQPDKEKHNPSPDVKKNQGVWERFKNLFPHKNPPPPKTPVRADSNSESSDDWIVVSSPNDAIQADVKEPTPDDDYVLLSSPKTIIKKLDEQCKKWQTPENTSWTILCKGFQQKSIRSISHGGKTLAADVMASFTINGFQISKEDLNILGSYNLGLFIAEQIMPTPTLSNPSDQPENSVKQQTLALLLKEWFEYNIK